MLRFIVAGIAGGVAFWLWGDQIRRFAATRTHDVRETAADAIQSVQVKTGEILDSAKEQVSSTLQAGQDAIRPVADLSSRRAALH